ncbi:MAG TPA: N(4)-(beta-N-acetylglucosaminyl)-L-asparaginase [Candidatus Acidoferrales bacterium]|nr:N(4)-(beta-N-acetylglucosaminyl)-L-asparaginase [Candidatus Acidoferrales bacterium]
MKNWTRRKFFLTTLAGGFAAGAQRLLGAALPTRAPAAVTDLSAAPTMQAVSAKSTRPVIISSANGLHALQKGMDILKSGGDTLDAAIAAVTVVEDDPNDNSVGFGGLPNEEGEPELDSCLMHGPTRRAGAVGGLRRVKNAARVANTILQRTNHVFLVGDGAYKFAMAEGFESQSLLTEKSRMAWLAWKAHTNENWAPGLDSPEWKERLDALLDTPEKKEWASWINEVIANPPTGTIPCMAANENGEISGVVTTSGLAWKIPGRVGDSAVIGAGMFCDGDVGAAGSTGRGEENIKISGGHTIVELMRHGMSPQDACMEAMHRVIRNYTRGYPNEKERLAKIGLQFYALNKDGAHGAATLWGTSSPEHNDHYAVHDGAGAKLVPCEVALQRS